MAFIVCVIGPGKSTSCAKSILVLNILQLYTFPDSRFVGVNHTQSCETAHWPLLHLVVWYRAPVTTSLPHSLTTVPLKGNVALVHNFSSSKMTTR